MRGRYGTLYAILSLVLGSHGFVVVKKSWQPPVLRSEASRALPQSVFLKTSAAPLNMVKYEDLMEKLPSATVVEAVDRMPSSRVVASDVAAAAGVSLSQARKDLTALASLSRGDIAVDKDGELIYTFPDNLKAALASNSFKYNAVAALRKAWPGIFWFIRVSFGVTLLVSLLAIFSTIIFLQSSSSSSDDRDDRRRGGGMSFGGSYMWGPSPFDFLYWSRPYGYYASPDKSPEEMGFLMSVFSYVFGDGDPNARLEEKRISLVANMIRENNGAVTAEQLAPFCDDAPDPGSYDNSNNVDERFVLPLVTALNGEPQVTEQGDIVYVFPELQVSASSSASAIRNSATMITERGNLILRRAGLPSDASAGQIKRFLDWNGVATRGALERSDLLQILEQALPPLSSREQSLDESDSTRGYTLQEREYEFSLAPEINRFLAAGLGVVNLGGALYLGNLLGQYALYGVKLPSYLGLVQQGYPLLLAYAVLFNAIPLARWLWIRGQNAQIQIRNSIRQQWKAILDGASRGNGTLARKLQAASKYSSRLRQLGADKNDIVFDTSKPIEEIQKVKNQQALEEFDKLLGNNIDDSQTSFQ